MAAAPRLILHCGLHKTGTSTLQFALARARPALAASGVLYPTNRALGIDLDVAAHNPLAARLLAAGGDSAAVAQGARRGRRRARNRPANRPPANAGGHRGGP